VLVMAECLVVELLTPTLLLVFLGSSIDNYTVERILLHWAKHRKRFSVLSLISERNQTKFDPKVRVTFHTNYDFFSQVENSRNSCYFPFFPKTKNPLFSVRGIDLVALY